MLTKSIILVNPPPIPQPLSPPSVLVVCVSQTLISSLHTQRQAGEQSKTEGH